jgi:hypothetical protein
MIALNILDVYRHQLSALGPVASHSFFGKYLFSV